jgi:CRISPR-associated protein (TIGR03986 family)
VPLNKNIAISNGVAVFSKFLGLSGLIELKIKTKSPLFIRGSNGLFASREDQPYIPGSSLRGLIRNLVNITSYGKLDQYSDRKLFRRSSMLSNGKNVSAGFLRKENGIYIIEKANAVQLSQAFQLAKHPHQYVFDVSKKTCNFSVGEFLHTCRVWSFTLLSGKIEVSDNAIKEYELDDTRSEKAVDLLKSIKIKKIVNGNEDPIDDVPIPSSMGVPVFYRIENGKVSSFGHAKYHRIPYPLSISDHIIQDLTEEEDFSESIFGTLNQPSKVFFDDFYLDGKPRYDLTIPKKPKILSSPKPTTFQHYLEQPTLSASQSQQNKWSTPDVPIRGFKGYWHRETSSDVRNRNTWIETEEACKSNPDAINPISIDSVFEGNIRFENFSQEELGALIFVLELPPDCNHKIGMGKPFGLGSIEIKIEQLALINREHRYEILCDKDQWNQSIIDETINKDSFKNSFAKLICEQIPNATYDPAKGFMSLWENDRLTKLREMLLFHHDMGNAIVSWDNRTRYMENGAGNSGVNEFKYRPILPTPEIVVQKNTYQKP